MDDTGMDEEETITEIAKTQATLSTLYEKLASIDVGLFSSGMWLGWYDLADRRDDVQRQIDSLEERLDKLTRERDRQKKAKCNGNAGDATPADATHGSEHDTDTIWRIAQALERADSVTVRTKDGRTIEATAIIYDGSDWYAASGTGTYDRHGLHQYETGKVIRASEIA